MESYRLGAQILAVNLFCLAAMGAKPIRGVLMSLALSQSVDEQWVMQNVRKWILRHIVSNMDALRCGVGDMSFKNSTHKSIVNLW